MKLWLKPVQVLAVGQLQAIIEEVNKTWHKQEYSVVKWKPSVQYWAGKSENLFRDFVIFENIPILALQFLNIVAYRENITVIKSIVVEMTRSAGALLLSKVRE